MTRNVGSTGIYCRISDDSEGVGRGIARQEADARALAERLGLDVVHVWADNSISAFSGKVRPGYLAACAAIETGEVRTLIADHPDRLHRSPRELEDFVTLVERTGCRVVTVTAGDLDFTTPEGRLMARITGAVARKESEDKQRRITRKMAELRDRGRPTGRLGFAYDDGGVLNPEKAAIVSELAQRILDGETLTELCAELTRRGVPTRLGGAWRPTTLRVTMTAPSLAGLQSHKGEIIGEGDWEPALDRVTWERVRHALNGRRRSSPGRYLLSGIAQCGDCGRRLAGASREGVKLYACYRQGGGCGRVYIVRDRLDELVEARMIAMLADDALNVATPSVDAEQLAVDITDAEEKLASYARMLDAGELQPIEWRTLRGAAVRRLEALRDREQLTAGAVAVVAEGESWAALPDSRRRALIEQTISVTVNRAKSRGGRFDPSRVEVRWLR